ncbi:MAG: polyprenyl synthetase family protein [Candidatus Kapaibacteriales bacterium]
MNALDEITIPIRSELEEFDSSLHSTLKTKSRLLDLIISYLMRRKGKRIRPTLVFLSANLIGKANTRTHIGATMIELLHTATLVHDDVVDEADERRGLKSINARWNNKIAVLLGDFLLAKGLSLAIENNEFEFLRTLSNAVRLMSEGELLQIQTARENNANESRYFEIIFNKTASLISSCTEVGAISVTNDPEIRVRLREFGKLLGYAFQIRDDILDFVGNSNIVGKPIGNDIRQRKITLPLIYALRNVQQSQANEIIKIVKSRNNHKKDIRQIIEFVIENKGIVSAQNKALQIVNEAKELLSDFPINPAKESLLKLADYVIERVK